MFDLEKKQYESPQLTVVQFRIEGGFAYSLALSHVDFTEGYGDEMLEERTTCGYFGDNEGWF